MHFSRFQKNGIPWSRFFGVFCVHAAWLNIITWTHGASLGLKNLWFWLSWIWKATQFYRDYFTSQQKGHRGFNIVYFHPEQNGEETNPFWPLRICFRWVGSPTHQPESKGQQFHSWIGERSALAAAFRKRWQLVFQGPGPELDFLYVIGVVIKTHP